HAPDVRVAFLDVDDGPGGSVSGLAIPVDPARLASFDAREVNYRRVDVSHSFRPALPHPVFVYRGTGEARARCRVRPAAPELCVSEAYLAEVRQGFTALGPDHRAEFERVATPLPFPLRPLELVRPEGYGPGVSGLPSGR